MASEITILGANGTKGFEGGTSAFLIDAYNVIDAGNLLRPMREAAAEIETVWLTHSHLDHIVDIAYILDSYFSQRKKTLTLRGLPATLDAIKKHFLNDLIWPDFSKIKLTGSSEMALEYHPIEMGKVYQLDKNSSIEAYITDHTVESCGYIIHKNSSAVLISADTYDLQSTIASVENDSTITTLVIECSFPSSMRTLAKESKHLTPELLFNALKPIEKRGLRLNINHIKPQHEKIIRDELDLYKNAWRVEILNAGKKIHF